jgi:hypothetical protein
MILIPPVGEGFYTGSNQDLSTNQLLELVSSLKRSWRLFYVPVETLFSQMAYKRAAVEWLSRRNYPAELVEPFRLRESPTYKQSCNPS